MCEADAIKPPSRALPSRAVTTSPFDFTRLPFVSTGEEEEKPASAEPKAFSVAELNVILGRAVEGAFPRAVWVQGEVSAPKFAPSGHLYFSLKDEAACISAVMFRTQVTKRVRELLRDGTRVRARGVGSIYVQRGSLQFQVDRLEPEGRGAQFEALERLKKKLQDEGLFAIERKRPLPASPRIIGVVTSETGAVIHDICRVAFRRGGANILLAPAVVQGERAAEAVRRALIALSRVPGVDVIIVGRGGGSSEDLFAFNDEALARAIAACPVPVVSAVGHEVDVTLADFVADARAATPSQAAEMTVPDRRADELRLREGVLRLHRALRARLDRAGRDLAEVERRVRDPRLALHGAGQALDDRRERLVESARLRVKRERETLGDLRLRLERRDPQMLLARDKARLLEQKTKLFGHGEEMTRDNRAELGRLAASLDALSPLRVLGRGYALAETKGGVVVRRIDQLAKGDAVRIRVGDGSFAAKVTAVSGPTPQLALPLGSDRSASLIPSDATPPKARDE